MLSDLTLVIRTELDLNPEVEQRMLSAYAVLEVF